MSLGSLTSTGRTTQWSMPSPSSQPPYELAEGGERVSGGGETELDS